MFLKNNIFIKNPIKSFLLISMSLMVLSCEDVVDIEVPTEEPRLVIEASLDWEKGTSGSNQTIKLSMSTPYYDTTPNPVSGATVRVTNETNGSIFLFEDQNDGNYFISNFEPILDHTYFLEVSYDNELYTARETMLSVPEFNRIEQSYDGGFNDEALEVTYYFDDPPNVENFYLSSFQEEGTLFQELEVISDEFTDGNEMFNFFEKDDDNGDDDDYFQPGDVVFISLYGISDSYYNFMQILIEQYDAGGDPFSSIAAEIRGNCINPENPENYAFGYFRATEVVRATYIFE